MYKEAATTREQQNHNNLGKARRVDAGFFFRKQVNELAITETLWPSDSMAPKQAPSLARQLKAYAAPDTKRSLTQLGVTAVGFCTLYVGMWLVMGWNYPAALLLSVAAGGFLVRLFMMQHDCSHCALFKSRSANDIIGRILGVLTMTPYAYWKRIHSKHHATAGDLDRRGTGDVTTLTVDEFLSLPRWRRLAYRLYRNPFVLFGLGPLFLFVFKHRAPFDLPLREKKMWLSVLGTNLAIGAALGSMAMTLGPLAVLKLHLPVMLTASSIGIWLFFIQHQFHGVSWRRHGQWQQQDAALRGSSYYRLPHTLQWLTANIGLHHVHHLCSRIPNYRLQEAMDQIPELRAATCLDLWRSFGCAKLALWDEKQEKLVRFRELKRLQESHQVF